MKEKMLHAYGMIDDKYIEESISEKIDKKKHKPLHWAVAAAVILGLLFSIEYKVNAQFHQWIVSIVHIKTKDEIKSEQPFSNQINKETNGNAIQISEVKNIDDIIDAQYVTAEYYVDAYKDIYIASKNNKETYFYIKNNKFVPIDKTKRIACKVKWKKYIGHMRANIISYNGKQYVRNLDADLDNMYKFDLSIDAKNNFWIIMSTNSNVDSYSYPLKYNMDTGKITDIFRKVTIKKKSLQKYKIVTNWKKISNRYCSVLVGNSLKDAEYYLIDVTNQIATSIEKMTKVRDIQFLRGTEQCLFFGTMSSDTEGDCYDCYSYNLDTKECKVIYHHIKIWGDDNIDVEGMDQRVAFSGGRYDLMAQNNITYLVDEITGEKIKIEGLDQRIVGGDVMINDKGDKLLISTGFSEKGIKQVGILDIEKKKLYMFKRENSTDYKEFSISWQDDHTVAIQASDDYDESAVYLYAIK